MLVIACHEIWHVLVGLLLGGELTMFCIDPNMGGFTNFMGPFLDQQLSVSEGYAPTDGLTHTGPGMQTMLLMGYFGSAVIGFFLVVSHLLLKLSC